MSSHALRLSSPPDDVDTVHDFLADVWKSSSVDPMERFRFETALIELAANVMRHAAGRDGVTCSVTIQVSDSSIEAELVDDGEPGDIDLDRAMPDTLEESGRGIPLIRALVDEVVYSRTGDANRWHIARSL
ncbi:MAG: ATP-binding protein [Naasia sp.]